MEMTLISFNFGVNIGIPFIAVGVTKKILVHNKYSHTIYNNIIINLVRISSDVYYYNSRGAIE